MLLRYFSEPEIEPLLHRYDPEKKWQLDKEKSYKDMAIFCEPGADLETSRYLKMRYLKPDYLFVERWDGSHYRVVDALYKKTEKGYKKLMHKRHRKHPTYDDRLFPNSAGSSSNGSSQDDEIIIEAADQPQS